MSQENDPRATVVRNVAEQQQLIEKVLLEIPSEDKVNLEVLVSLYQKCSQIREQPEFVDLIFSKNDLYQEYLTWILDPEKLKEKLVNKKENSSKLLRYPQRCANIAKNNPAFYESLYIKALFDSTFLSKWFKILKQSKSTCKDTSLGYFSDIMIPFLKYQFADSSKICEIMEQAILTQNDLVHSGPLVRTETLMQLQRKILASNKMKNFLSETISILRIFPDPLIDLILEMIDEESIFKFLHNLILVSLEENDLKRSKCIFEKFLRKSINSQSEWIIFQSIKPPQIDICSEYILQIVKQIEENANTDKNYRVIFFIDSILRVQLIERYLQRIQSSTLMIFEKQEKLGVSSSIDFTFLMMEEECLEFYFKSLTYFIKIYSKMIRNIKTEQQVQRQSKYYSNANEEQLNGQHKVMNDFAAQINSIYQKLPLFSNLVKKNQIRSIPFSSGQNIKPITLCKYEYFQLIYNCLLLARQYPDDFILDTEKINLFSIVEKYLNENRWNNIAHKILQKIANLLIINNDNFFRTKEMNKNNMADQFLNGIIQNFTNRSYIFLNSFRFTTQGNIHTLFVIAKTIIYELKKSQKLGNFIHQVDYYKKFVMNDLQTYEIKTLQIKYPADQDDLRSSERKSSSDSLKLQVDELSIQQIVRKIQVINKWPVKQTKKKSSSMIQRSLSQMEEANRYSPMTYTIKQNSSHILNQQHDLDDRQDDFLQKFRVKSGLIPEKSREFLKSFISKESKEQSDHSLLDPTQDIKWYHKVNSVEEEDENGGDFTGKQSMNLNYENQEPGQKQVQHLKIHISTIKDTKKSLEDQKKQSNQEGKTQNKQ